MKRTVLWFSAFLLASLLCLAGWFLLGRGGLGAWPSSEYPLRFLREAFMLPDGDWVVLEDGGRLVRLAPDGMLRWEARSDGALFGEFLAAAMGDDGALYVIDRIEGDVRFERVVRVGRDGKPAGVLAQKRFEGPGGFTPGALAVHDGSVWYLVTDDAGRVSLARVGERDGRERVLIKSDWTLSSAALAPGGPGGAVAIASGGGIIRYIDGRFELLSGFADELPYPSGLRYSLEGTLLVADAYRNEIVAIGADGSTAALFDRAALAALAGGGTDIVIGSFHERNGIFSFVERSSSTALRYDAAGGSFRTLPAAFRAEDDLRMPRLAWALLRAAAALGALAVCLAGSLAVRRGPAFLAAATGALPGLAAGALFLFWMAGAQADGALERQRAERAEELAAKVEAAAASLDPGLLESLALPRDAGKPEYGRLRGQLEKLAGDIEAGGFAGAYATVYGIRGDSLRYLCDQGGYSRPGLPQPYAPPSYREALLEGAIVKGVVEDPQGVWIAAAVPLGGGRGQGGILEVSMDGVDRSALAWPSLTPGLAGGMAGALALVVAGALCAVAAGKRSKARRAARAEEEAAEEGEEGEVGSEEREEREEPFPPVADSGGQAGRKTVDAGPALPAATSKVPQAAAGARQDLPARVGLKQAHAIAVREIQAGRFERAVRILERILSVNPKDARAYNNLGIACKGMGRSAKALACFEKAHALDPANASYRTNVERMRSLVP